MAETSFIEWTDATWNPITGCSVVSPGCTNCYAMKLAGTRLKHHPSRAGLTRDSKAGPVWNGEVRLNCQWLRQPHDWKRPRMIFVCAHGDLFHESVPDEWIDMVFAVMALAPQHTFQVLSKRAERMRAYVADEQLVRCREIARAADRIAPRSFAAARWPLPNLWLGVSAEGQKEADERIPHLLATPAAVRFLSLEPLLGPIDFCATSAIMPIEEHPWRNGPILQGIHWVIVGGESGKGARPMHPDWARSLRDQCASAGVPFFFKQWGEYHPSNEHAPDTHKACDATPAALHVSGKREYRPIEAGWLIWKQPGWAGMCAIGKKASGRLLDGVEHNGMPQVQP